MQSQSRILDDLAKVANGAVSTLSGIKAEVETMVRQQMERLLADADMVPRDEFEAVKAVAVKARTEQEKLEKRVAKLEAQLKPASKTKAVAKKPPAKKAAAKNSTKKSAAKRSAKT